MFPYYDPQPKAIKSSLLIEIQYLEVKILLSEEKACISS